MSSPDPVTQIRARLHVAHAWVAWSSPACAPANGSDLARLDVQRPRTCTMALSCPVAVLRQLTSCSEMTAPKKVEILEMTFKRGDMRRRPGAWPSRPRRKRPTGRSENMHLPCGNPAEAGNVLGPVDADERPGLVFGCDGSIADDVLGADDPKLMTRRERETSFPEITTPSKTASSELATPKMTTGRLASFLVKRPSTSGMRTPTKTMSGSNDPPRPKNSCNICGIPMRSTRRVRSGSKS